MQIAVVDYGMGNLRSVERALRYVAPTAEVVCTSSAAAIERAEAVVFPGQGSFADCMAALAREGLTPAVVRAARERPFLGICVGLQLLFEHSEEGDVAGLGLFRGRVVRFAQEERGERLKVPHMGWNSIRIRHNHPVLPQEVDGSYFYFVHSFHACDVDEDLVLAVCEYGGVFPAAVAKGGLVATQFHPEKSGRAGLALLSRFVRWAEDFYS
ncbi:MAG: imidazole glycerol phosphate synthase subunit HisH [Hydrogenophilus sp.]|nr:imidazole glycerol phosphate synthase subunit HisH [Hydrogenophilus sp.]